jgi:septum formation protein
VNVSFLLASNSPRRRALLAEVGFDFATVVPEAVERFDVDLTLRELTAFNAIRKAMSVARMHPGKIVLAADTLVALGHEIIGKPKDRAEAIVTLRRLSGCAHEVCSSVFICQLARAGHGESVRWRTRSTSFQEISRVHFRKLSDAAIRAYIDEVDPLDKAGAYAAQGSGVEIIQKIEGSYSNVVGLPMEKTVAALTKFGIRPKPA